MNLQSRPQISLWRLLRHLDLFFSWFSIIRKSLHKQMNSFQNQFLPNSVKENFGFASLKETFRDIHPFIQWITPPPPPTPLADLGGARTRSQAKTSFIYMQFSGKTGQIIGCPLGWALPLRGSGKSCINWHPPASKKSLNRHCHDYVYCALLYIYNKNCQRIRLYGSRNTKYISELTCILN